MFYSSNAMLFCLALLSREPYWEISEAVAMCKDKVSLVNKDWHVDRSALPKIFDGGLYGAMCRKQSYKLFICLYLSSVVLMGLNSYLVWYCDGSYLGLVGLVSNLVYDIFILSFNSLPSTEKSLASTFILVFLGRLLSFVFGTTYWIFGYCILYFFIGVFVGKLIINRRLPMKF